MTMGNDRDKVFDLIDKERLRQLLGAELIASENFVSDEVLRALGSVLTNKYAEGLPRRRYYGGCEVVDEVEQLAIDRAKELFGAVWANVQPHSGAQANAAVMLAVLKPGDRLVGFDLAHGGHLTHGSGVNFSGKLYEPHFYGVEKDSGRIDYVGLEKIVRQVKPKLLICGASSYARDWDYERFRQLADETGALLMADIAHPAGLIATGLLNDPLRHCHIVTTTTHKTLRGPRGGMILLSEDVDNPMGYKTPKGVVKKLSAVLDGGVFPGTQGGPLEHVIAAKAVAFQEALSPSFEHYTKQVLANARRMAKEFVDRGYQVLTGGTDNHIVLIDLRNKGLSGKEAEAVLGKVNVTVNKNMVPFDDKSPFVTSGIRLGTSALTTRGLNEEEVSCLVGWIDEALVHKDRDVHLSRIREEVQKTMEAYPLFSDRWKHA